MQFSNPLVVVGIFFVVLFVVALLVGLLSQRRHSVSEATPESSPQWANDLASPAPVAGERMASPISEAIEALVRERMAADASLRDVKLDFGSSPDGALEIWVNDERFTDLEHIRDESIKAMIREAVSAYNQGKT